MKNQNPTEEDLVEALKRSGYLFESQIAKLLYDHNFFVETNQVFPDPLTGKNREVDIIAEYDTRGQGIHERKLATSIRFVFELKNNIFPVVLLTPYTYSPNVEIWNYFKVTQTGKVTPDFNHKVNFHEYLLDSENIGRGTFTQYCSFQKKKQGDVLMAFHPDELYEGILKVAQYCQQYADWNFGHEYDGKHDYYRNFLYLPVILLKDDLFETNLNDKGEMALSKVDQAKIVFNYHYKDRLQSAIIYFITEAGLPSFAEDMLQIEQQVKDQMNQLLTDTKNDKFKR